MLRKVLLATALSVCVAGPAFAEIVPSWTGLYVGLNVGGGGDGFYYPGASGYEDVVPDVDNDPVSSTPFSGRQSSAGVIGGVQLGYDVQSSHGFVLGVVADFDGTSIGGHTPLSTPFDGADAAPVALTGSINSRFDYIGTLRLRIGKPLGLGRLMPYVTGGFAYAGLNSTAASNITLNGESLYSGTTSKTSARIGWTVGAGLEYRMSDRLSVGVEYLYADFGTRHLIDGALDTGIETGDGDGAIDYELGIKAAAHLGRITLNYRFGP